ncbi:hypothetical protein [Robertmurraya andreesenii]|uniref:Ribosomal protein L21E n=1 Tax=Anoxybacillus andreesenii TaxID=1325932 RepID=A0ABT9V1Y1_9BACL|nr:hypothetical protein [Robertmurraya andreesenii]MDQ0154963.1 ribosomal protein L21E [Robertmurraya andreesenii]
MAKLNGVKTLDMVNGEITKVEYNGAVYEKVDGKAQAGDIGLRIRSDASWANIGSFYLVVRDGVYSDNGGFEPYIEVSQWHFFRKVADASAANQSPTPSTDALTDRVSTLEQRVDKLEGKTESDGFKLVTDREPKAGDFAKFSEGDTVKLVIKEGKRPHYGYGLVDNGEIGTIREIRKDLIKVDFPSQSGWSAKPNELEKVSAEELAKQAETARWASIGRKPNEFKKGDIVRLNQDSGANYKGEIVEIAQDGADSYFDENGDRYAGALHWFELITPVEQRFDKTEATA